jgi:hypothetical protein
MQMKSHPERGSKSTRETFLRDLGKGLILRRATRQDVERLVEFNGVVHAQDGSDQPEEKVMAWVRDLLAGSHPTFDPGDFTMVEEANSGKIVSSLNLISQTWSYAGIPFKVGRPELVGTLPEFRNMGLVRAQFETIHRWGEEKGQMLQAITGIPYYYRLFEYEMAMDLGAGRMGYSTQVPRLKDGEVEPYHVRKAVEGDIPFMAQVYDQTCKRSLVAAVWDEDLWRYELSGKSEKNVNRRVLNIIETAEGEPVGMLSHTPWLWGSTFSVGIYELKLGISWSAVTPSVLRYMRTMAEIYSERDKTEFKNYGFWVGSQHPVFQVAASSLPRLVRTYAWYLRVPDLPGFLQHISPVLERRLAESPMVGHSGELKITFYRNGLRLVFDEGRIKQIEPWRPAPLGHSGDAAFPGLTFLQIVFGYRSIEELEYAFADCWIDKDEARVLIASLFPKQASDVWAVA